MPFTALKRHQDSTNDSVQGADVVRRLMPFTALKHCVLRTLFFPYEVVRRLMPFTALKPLTGKCDFAFLISSCAPPNAVYGIETTLVLFSRVGAYN